MGILRSIRQGTAAKAGWVVLVAVGIAVTIALAYHARLFPWQERMDAPILSAIAKASALTMYSQRVETRLTLPDRSLSISGIYHVDRSHSAFEALSTTTLGGAGPGLVFTLHNISLGDQVYVKVETPSPLLAKSIPASPQWRHFSARGIPPQFTGIAIAGPILDNLLIFSENGAYLSFEHKVGAEAFGDTQLARYTFRLSDKIPTDAQGTLAAILDHIGTGTVEVWVDESAEEVRGLSFRAVGYSSTTTLSHLEESPGIAPPAGVR